MLTPDNKIVGNRDIFFAIYSCQLNWDGGQATSGPVTLRLTVPVNDWGMNMPYSELIKLFSREDKQWILQQTCLDEMGVTPEQLNLIDEDEYNRLSE